VYVLATLPPQQVRRLKPSVAPAKRPFYSLHDFGEYWPVSHPFAFLFGIRPARIWTWVSRANLDFTVILGRYRPAFASFVCVIAECWCHWSRSKRRKLKRRMDLSLLMTAWHTLAESEQDAARRIWGECSERFSDWFGVLGFAKMSLWSPSSYRIWGYHLEDEYYEWKHERESRALNVWPVSSLSGPIQPCPRCHKRLPLQEPDEGYPWMTYPLVCDSPQCGNMNMRIPWWRYVEPEVQGSELESWEGKEAVKFHSPGLQWKQQADLAFELGLRSARAELAARCLDCGKVLEHRRSRQVRCPDCQRKHAAELLRQRVMRHRERVRMNDCNALGIDEEDPTRVQGW